MKTASGRHDLVPEKFEDAIARGDLVMLAADGMRQTRRDKRSAAALARLAAIESSSELNRVLDQIQGDDSSHKPD